MINIFENEKKFFSNFEPWSGVQGPWDYGKNDFSKKPRMFIYSGEVLMPIKSGYI